MIRRLMQRYRTWRTVKYPSRRELLYRNLTLSEALRGAEARSAILYSQMRRMAANMDDGQLADSLREHIGYSGEVLMTAAELEALDDA